MESTGIRMVKCETMQGDAPVEVPVIQPVHLLAYPDAMGMMPVGTRELGIAFQSTQNFALDHRAYGAVILPECDPIIVSRRGQYPPGDMHYSLSHHGFERFDSALLASMAKHRGMSMQEASTFAGLVLRMLDYTEPHRPERV